MVTGLATCFFCPLIPVFLGLGAILSLEATGFGLAGFVVVAAFFFSEGFALDFVLRAAAFADPGFAVGTDADFFSAALGAAAAGLAAAGLGAAGTDLVAAALGVAAFGAGAGVLAVAGFGAAVVVEAALGAGAGVLDVAGFFSAVLDPVDPDAKTGIRSSDMSTR